MKHPLSDLINRRIEQAFQDGAFDNLPGQGKPLTDMRDPMEALLQRAAEEGGGAIPHVSMREQLTEARAELKKLSDPRERREKLQQISDIQTRLAVELEQVRRNR